MPPQKNRRRKMPSEDDAKDDSMDTKSEDLILLRTSRHNAESLCNHRGRLGLTVDAKRSAISR